jgi:hypothetical protein
MRNTGAEKASPQLMVGLHARKTDGHQTHSVKVFSLDWIFIDRCIISYMWFLVFSTLLLTYSQCRVYRILKILCYTGSVFCRPLVVVVVSGCECACMLCLGWIAKAVRQIWSANAHWKITTMIPLFIPSPKHAIQNVVEQINNAYESASLNAFSAGKYYVCESLYCGWLLVKAASPGPGHRLVRLDSGAVEAAHLKVIE